MASELHFSERLNKKIRKGNWQEQLISTYEKICVAIQEKRNENAVELVNYFMEEARICYDIYVQWSADFIRFIQDQSDIIYGEVEGMSQDLLELLGENGEPFGPEARWLKLHEYKSKLIRGIHGKAPIQQLLQETDHLREYWRKLHDKYVDYCYGILVYIANRFGEESIETAYREYAIGDLFDYRYRFFSPEADWEESFEILIYNSIESMRAHLCGPRRFGEMDFAEDEEKVVIEFDPCGSGGRTIRGDHIEGTPPRMESPYNFRVTQKEYDWAWNKKGVCYYCAHCSILMENIPMEKWGYPVRVVEPPTYPDRKEAKCKWTMYKDPKNVPDEVWTRHGMKKPVK